MNLDTWFAFRAIDLHPHYGFGTEKQANAFIDHLNSDRETRRTGCKLFPMSKCGTST